MFLFSVLIPWYRWLVSQIHPGKYSYAKIHFLRRCYSYGTSRTPLSWWPPAIRRKVETVASVLFCRAAVRFKLVELWICALPSRSICIVSATEQISASRGRLAPWTYYETWLNKFFSGIEVIWKFVRVRQTFDCGQWELPKLRTFLWESVPNHNIGHINKGVSWYFTRGYWNMYSSDERWNIDIASTP